MASYYKLDLEERKNLGTSAARSIRRNGGVLVNYYYTGEENKNFLIDKKSLQKAIQSGNRVFELDINNETIYAMIKDAQYHPVTEQILHIDLLRVRRDEKMKISIPLVLEGNSAGVVQGGILTQTLSNIDIQCFPTDVPENIIVDITKLDLNSSITAGDLKLDEDITLETLPDTTIVACNEPKVELEPTVDEIADTDDGASVQEDSSSDVDSKETNSDENKKES
ncbi:MAG: 50S ribosomal protein L25 [bacterium TMED144]|nr:MAG: 50S ribosomal protein L25 [bacterium TMED144]